MKVQNYKELIVWQKAIELVVEIYAITGKFPPQERFGLSSQMQRASVSIPSNIAEGACRNHTPEYLQHLGIACGSSAELETQIVVAKRIYPRIAYAKVESLNTEIQKMLNGLMASLR